MSRWMPDRDARMGQIETDGPALRRILWLREHGMNMERLAERYDVSERDLSELLRRAAVARG